MPVKHVPIRALCPCRGTALPKLGPNRLIIVSQNKIFNKVSMITNSSTSPYRVLYCTEKVNNKKVQLTIFFSDRLCVFIHFQPRADRK